MRAEIQSDRCLGYGECAILAPHLFRLGDDNQSHPVDDAEQWKDTVAAEEAAAACPTAAIKLVDS